MKYMQYSIANCSNHVLHQISRTHPCCIHQTSQIEYLLRDFHGFGESQDVEPVTFIFGFCFTCLAAATAGTYLLSRVRLCATLWTPGSSVHGILQARILEWVAVFSSRGPSQPRDRTRVSCIAGRFLITDPPGKPHLSCYPLSNTAFFYDQDNFVIL